MFDFKIKKNLGLIAASLFSLGASAQAVIWGAGHPTNPTLDSIGRFAKPSAVAPTGGLSSLGWTSSGAGPTGPTQWIWSADGVPSGPNSLPRGEIIDSTIASVHNGVAMFDSDYWGYGAGGAGYPHTGELVSPSIDMTGFADSVIAVRFYSAHRDFNSPAWTVDFSTDNGTTWISSSDVRTASGDRYNGWIELNFGTPLTGLTSLDSCRLRFSFEGDAYNWTIDDVSVVVGNDYDFGFAEAAQDYSYTVAYAPLDFANLPLSQVTAPNATGPARQYYVYGALAYNRGGKDLPLSANPSLNVDIQRWDAASAVWVSEHSFDEAFTRGANAGDTVSLASGVWTYNSGRARIKSNPLTGWQPTQTGNYRIQYTVSHDLTEGNRSNDTLRREFEITDSVYSSPGATGGLSFSDVLSPVNMSANNAQEFEMGAIYYFPAGSGWYIDSISYLLYGFNTFRTNFHNQIYPVSLRIYKWFDGYNGGTANNEAEIGEYVFSSAYTDSVLVDSSVKLYELQAPMYDPDNRDPVTNLYTLPYHLEDDALYIITIRQESNSGLVNNSGTSATANCFAICYAPVYHQGRTVFGTGDAIGDLLSSGGFEYGISNGQLQTGFGNVYDFAPSMALHLTDTLRSADDDDRDVGRTATLKGNFEVFPSPATATLTTKVDLETPSSSVRYIVTDLTGRVMTMETRKNVQNDLFTVEVKNYPAGVYFVHIKTDAGSISKRFVKK